MTNPLHDELTASWNVLSLQGTYVSEKGGSNLEDEKKIKA
jgi:hypothetical protein